MARDVTTAGSGILAFNDPGHGSSFCLYAPDEVVHVELERLSRVKYDSKNPIMDFCDLFVDTLSEFGLVAVEEGIYFDAAIRRLAPTKCVPRNPDPLSHRV